MHSVAITQIPLCAEDTFSLSSTTSDSSNISDPFSETIPDSWEYQCNGDNVMLSFYLYVDQLYGSVLIAIHCK